MMLEEKRVALLQSTGEAMLVGRVGEAADVAAAHPDLMENGFTAGTVLSIDSGAVLA